MTCFRYSSMSHATKSNFYSMRTTATLFNICGKQNRLNTPQAWLHFPLILTNRFNETESAIFKSNSFSPFMKDTFFEII